MITADDTVLLVIDIQGNLAQLMDDKERLFDNAARLIRGARALGVPIVWAEQNPKGLGDTVPQVADALAGLEPVPKMSFSCCGEPRIMKEIEGAGRKNALLAGIETHVCVYQTAMDLLARGYEVYIVADAVSSRASHNKEIALRRLVEEGARLNSVEMALFEMMATAEHEKFREMVKIVK